MHVKKVRKKIYILMSHGSMHPKEALVVSDKRGERIHTFPYYISYSIMLPKRRGRCKIELRLIHPVEAIEISVLQIE
jgi:hypothetical protein